MILESDQPQTAFLDTAYTHVGNGWTRSFPWTWSRAHRDCFETIYKRGDRAVRVHVNRSWIKDATAAIFDVNTQIGRAQGTDNRRARRRGRSGKSQRIRRKRAAA